MIIARCSTNESKQDTSRQTKELKAKYASSFDIVKEYEYYGSGKTNDAQLGEILKYAVENNIQHLIFHEISRIARRVIETLVFVKACTHNKINVVIDNYNMQSLNADKTECALTTTMLQVGSAFSEAEIKFTYSRMNSGRKKYISEGGRLGRNKGTLESPDQTLIKHKDISKYLRQGQSVRNIMKLTGKSNGTILKVKKLLAA